MWSRFTSYDGAAKAQVDSLGRLRAEEYRRAYIAHHERRRANGRISLPRRYLVTFPCCPPERPLEQTAEGGLGRPPRLSRCARAQPRVTASAYRLR
jgi:hypothetical protein